ncbi:flagellar hook-associated protein FlgK [Clostridium sp. P21]|uniref:Flagellar hook-associated protein 1 n=1 Tax=Clostridium muellerianum TaxID=2716538 RepID=A0A7Y0ED58_9CLOT|nr:flagellar hook-associated protein FlgK [Clostridium muellerianum]NMM61268.1 flagellar hook-associated protein FlgK [Clostridium muellerianum]
MSGLFGTLNISKSGMFTQQRCIDVTSHNIANANTEGYSRQRAELQTTKPFPMPSVNNAVGPGQLGTGVQVVTIDRIRDSFLDYQIRVEKGVDGQYKGRDKFLSQIENILNEPSDTGLSKDIGNFFDAWNTLGTNAKESNSRSIVAQNTVTLTTDLNHTYNELEKLKENTQTVIKDDVFDINSKLKQVDQLNREIIQVRIAGNNPNDLMDRRDLLLDQLSEKFGISVDRKQFEGENVTTSDDAKAKDIGDDGRPPLAADGTTNLNLVQANFPDQACRFSYVDSIQPAGGQKAGEAGKYTLTYYKNGDKTSNDNAVTITVDIQDSTDKNGVKTTAADKFKQLNQCRVLWADNSGVALNVDTSAKSQGIVAGNLPAGSSIKFENLKLFQPPSGEIKGYMSVQKDIDTYEGQLNKFAKALAFAVNGIVSQENGAIADVTSGDNVVEVNNFFVNADAQKKGAYTGTNLTKIEEAEADITAGNITINQAILDDPMKIKTAAKYDGNNRPLTGESDGSRAVAVETLRDSLMAVQNIDQDNSTKTKKADFLDGIFELNSKIGVNTIINKTGGMTLDSYFKDTVDRLGIQEQEAKKTVTNQASLLAGFTQSRDSVSGVSLDEEMANLVQFQHCYQANAKLISTVDQLLDVVINGLKK